MANTKFSTSSINQGLVKSRSMLVGNTADISDFESISTVFLSSSGSSTIEFTSIPSTYTHLQVRSIMQTNRSGYVVDQLIWRFNDDSGSNYSHHVLYGGYTNSPIIESSAGISQTRITYPAINSSVASNVFSASIMDILDYANTNKYKTTKEMVGFDCNGGIGTDSMGGTIGLGSGNWRSTSAISKITITRTDGSNFNQYSHFALYGIRTA